MVQVLITPQLAPRGRGDLMSKIITGTWLYTSGLAVANGTLYLTLSQDAVVVGTSQVAPAIYAITLNSSGQIPANTYILANDELSPSGTVYKASVIASGGERVWGEQFLAITGASPINLNNLVPTITGGVVTYAKNIPTVNITYIIDGGGLAITTGQKGHVQVPIAGTITGWTLLADQIGSIVVDIWKDTYANFPPTLSDSIAGSEKPTLSSAQKNQDLALGTWTTSISAGDILAYNVDSAASVTRVAVILTMNVA